MKAFVLMLLAACKIVHTEGDASVRFGELVVCRGTISCSDTEPFAVNEDVCTPRSEAIEATIEWFGMQYPDCVADVRCFGDGSPENGGSGFPTLCLLHGDGDEIQ